MCKLRFGGTTFEVGTAQTLQMPVWCTIRDHNEWHSYILDHMPPIWFLARSELPAVVMNVVEGKVPLFQILAMLGLHGIAIPILNILLNRVPKEFLKAKPCTGVEKVCALLAWVLCDPGVNGLHLVLQGLFATQLPSGL